MGCWALAAAGLKVIYTGVGLAWSTNVKLNSQTSCEVKSCLLTWCWHWRWPPACKPTIAGCFLVKHSCGSQHSEQRSLKSSNSTRMFCMREHLYFMEVVHHFTRCDLQRGHTVPAKHSVQDRPLADVLFNVDKLIMFWNLAKCVK